MHYVVSDVHGREDRFDDILRQIRLKPEDRLYILGDVIDRNPAGLHLLRRIMRAVNMTMLLGNHEAMMLDALQHPEQEELFTLWADRNGGRVTYEKWKHCSTSYREELLSWMQTLPLNLSLTCAGKKFLLVHGAPAALYRVTMPQWQNKRQYAVWHRIEPWEPLGTERMVIFGHTPTWYYQQSQQPEIYRGDNRIGMDCGCAFEQGRLACLRLDDGMVFYSKV